MSQVKIIQMIFSILRERKRERIEFDIKIFHRPLSKRVVHTARRDISKTNRVAIEKMRLSREKISFERERARERSASKQKNATHIHHSIFLNLLTLLVFARKNTVSSISRYIINRNTDEKMLCGSTYCECRINVCV